MESRLSRLPYPQDLLPGLNELRCNTSHRRSGKVRYAFLLVLAAILGSVLHGTTAKADTWWVRGDGAPHYSAGIADLSWRGLDPKHTCDGLHDAAWPAPGTTNVLGALSDGRNQPCALSDWRWLYDNQGSYGQLSWIIKGGDTVILDNTKAWRVGWDGDGTNASSEPWCWGWNGGPYGCFNPTIPAGTAQQHTRILGRNYASCNSGNNPDKTRMSQLFGGHGVSVALNLADAQYVDVECVEITRHSQCVTSGSPMLPSGCSKSLPLDDYDSNGMWTGTGTHDLLLQDIWDHGHTSRGIIGPIGGLVTANRVDIDTNGMAGWDFDDGNSTASVNGVLKVNYSTIEWSGCNQEYPATHSVPVQTCYGQSNAGYGDGIGTPAGSGMDVFVDHTTFRNNVQDGPDFLHIDQPGHVFQFTNNVSYGNNGAALKFGSFENVTITNNVLIANCARLSDPVQGTVPGFNNNLGDFCRAFNGIVFGIHDNAQVVFANNTIVGYAPTLIDPACTDQSCAKAVIRFSNNIIRGYDNPYTYSRGGRSGGPGVFCGYQCDGTTQQLGTLIRDHNLYFGTRSDTLANQTTGYAVAEIAINEMGGVDPQFVNEPATFTRESDLDNYNTTLKDNSPATGMGAAAVYTVDAPTLPVITAPAPSAPAPPIGYLDNVAGSSTGSVSVAADAAIIIKGWAVENNDHGPAKSVKVLIDGIAAGSVIPSLARQDVVDQVTGTSASLDCGWSLTISASPYAVGPHTVTAVATDAIGQSSTLISLPAGFTVAAASPSPVIPVAAIPVSITVVLSDGSTYKGLLNKQ